jgi:hypothetical protein
MIASLNELQIRTIGRLVKRALRARRIAPKQARTMKIEKRKPRKGIREIALRTR